MTTSATRMVNYNQKYDERIPPTDAAAAAACKGLAVASSPTTGDPHKSWTRDARSASRAVTQDRLHGHATLKGPVEEDYCG